MLKNRFARLLAATVVPCALALSVLVAPSVAQDKMAPKMDSKMSGGKMMGGKMGRPMLTPAMHMKMMMNRMSASEKKTYAAMSAAEKALLMKMSMPPHHGDMGHRGHM